LLGHVLSHGPESNHPPVLLAILPWFLDL